jgi:uncharacterized protein (DUF2062 family)
MILNFKAILQKIKAPFQQGLGAKEVTKAIIISLLITVFPVFGVITLLLTFTAIKFKLNLPIMIVISYLATPLQYMFFLPFIHLGENIMNTSHTLLTVQEIKNAFDLSFFDTIRRLLFELICGISGWFLIALPISLIALFLNTKIMNLIQSRNAAH